MSSSWRKFFIYELFFFVSSSSPRSFFPLPSVKYFNTIFNEKNPKLWKWKHPVELIQLWSFSSCDFSIFFWSLPTHPCCYNWIKIFAVENSTEKKIFYAHCWTKIVTFSLLLTALYLSFSCKQFSGQHIIKKNCLLFLSTHSHMYV